MQLITLEEQGLTKEELNDIIECNMGLVRKQLYRFRMYDDAEAHSQGIEALWRAAQTYDDTYGTTFATYATACIYNALCGHYNKNNRPLERNTYSYNATTSEDADTAFEEFLTDGKSAADVYEEEQEQKYLKELLVDEVNKMTDMRQRIVWLWEESGFTVGPTEISEEVGCTQSYASFTLKIFQAAMRKRLKEIIW